MWSLSDVNCLQDFRTLQTSFTDIRFVDFTYYFINLINDDDETVIALW